MMRTAVCLATLLAASCAQADTVQYDCMADHICSDTECGTVPIYFSVGHSEQALDLRIPPVRQTLKLDRTINYEDRNIVMHFFRADESDSSFALASLTLRPNTPARFSMSWRASDGRANMDALCEPTGATQ